MRKLIFIFLLLFNTAHAQIGWSNLTSSQWISFQDAQGSGIYQKNPLPTSAQFMSKGDALYYLDVDTASMRTLGVDQFISRLYTYQKTYPGSATITWNYNVDSGLFGDYLHISRNGTSIVSVADNNSGSFTVYTGDVIQIDVRSANSGTNGNGATISIMGTDYEVHADKQGYSQVATKTFTFIDQYQDMSIQGVVASYTRYTNSAYSGQVAKNNCGDPSLYSGSLVTYTVPTGTYSSSISQEDADLQAQLDFYHNSQAYANTNGSCVAYNTSHSASWVFNQSGYATEKSTYSISVNGNVIISGNNLLNTFASGEFTVYDNDIIVITHTNYSSNTYYRSAGIVTQAGRSSSGYSLYDEAKLAYATIKVSPNDGQIKITFYLSYWSY